MALSETPLTSWTLSKSTYSRLSKRLQQPSVLNLAPEYNKYTLLLLCALLLHNPVQLFSKIKPCWPLQWHICYCETACLCRSCLKASNRWTAPYLIGPYHSAALQLPREPSLMGGLVQGSLLLFLHPFVENPLQPLGCQKWVRQSHVADCPHATRRRQSHSHSIVIIWKCFNEENGRCRKAT